MAEKIKKISENNLKLENVDEKFDVIDKLLAKFPLLSAAAKKSTAFALAIAHATEIIAKAANYSDRLASQLIAANRQLTLAAQNPKLKAEMLKYFKAVFDQKLDTIFIPPPAVGDEPEIAEAEAEPELEAATPEIVLEIMTLLDGIPLARRGDIISSEHHNSLRRAVNALARGIGASGEQTILNFSPDFLPVNQRLPAQFDWTVTFNKAIVPTNADTKDDNVKGAFTVQLPHNVNIQRMIVRGKRIGDEGNPSEFFVTLNRLAYDSPNANPEVIVEIDLKTNVGPFKESANAKSASLGSIDNTKFQYFILGYWKNAGGSDRFEINSIQIFCN
ncbi:MAG: hypothetical protein LUM44_01340 [Pyrinomonadaceae bacterium]|nr:hypothetical protein [Pyrinomonadaceae bacterium]